jgi:hypothetical protein
LLTIVILPGMTAGPVTAVHGRQGNLVCQAGGRSSVFSRAPGPDAVGPGTGERHPDVIMF